jgi:hypothetical protein
MYLAYAHYTYKGRKILNSLDIDPDCKFLVGNKGSLARLIKNIIIKKPKYIIGIGDYGGIDRSKIRIEAKCSNKFGMKLLGPELKEYDINYFFEENEIFKIANGIGKSYCNMASFYIMDLLWEKDLNSLYTFLHIPKGFDVDLAIEEINSQVRGLN